MWLDTYNNNESSAVTAYYNRSTWMFLNHSQRRWTTSWHNNVLVISLGLGMRELHVYIIFENS